ncbi:3-(3-hydroxy-phenyl)propionate hydroxylase [Bradyrhizobium brasilense]|uniref:3-(3-hydroxy-phenyl)propionate hydroxylase n=1 Tax=Bradyrhizobium brasilense TaxID=1419277 RepID=A0A1G6VST6_9BRAD|nr:FAD-dependent monooxygenase [Bradyrhizobium brasilense]SDD56672.1 3-(3-hydroxy-phenyl)propionate hydroxylase [Bradyrhizobium brasilense]
MREHAVVIAGGGPTGLMLAGELALAGIDVAIVERRAGEDLIGARAGGLHARTIEVLDQRGIGERFVALGTRHPAVLFHSHLVPLDITDFPTRRNFTLGLRQNHIERLLGEWVGELAVPIHRGREVTGFTQDEAGVDVELSDGQLLRAQYLVGCDGGRSLVRKAAGIEFAGWDPTTSWLIAEAEMAGEPEWGFRQHDTGTSAIGKAEDGGRVRLVLTERQLGTDREPTLRDVSEALVAAYGTDFGIHSPVWISRFTDMTRQALTYRKQRVLLAGDAAHVHPPMGGQGLNIGVQDAVNLGWKLAQVVKQIAPDSLLDTYEAERHPVAARVLRNTMAHVALNRTDPRTRALHEIVSDLLRMEEPRRSFAAMMSGLDLHYDLGDGHPLLGRRMPDLDLVTADGPMHVFALLHRARLVLLNFGEPDGIAIAGWTDRVQLVDAKYRGAWELPAQGTVSAPTAVLVRSDGYVAWVGERTQAGLTEALTKWFGASAGTS